MDSSAHNLLEIRSLRRAYPGVQALAGADFSLRAGEVHALVGENGAGKSTLCRMVCGQDRPDSGQMLLRGERWNPVDKPAARRAGVNMVLQELSLIPTLSVAENLFLDRLPNRCGVVKRTALEHAARAILEQFGLGGIEPRRPVSELGVGQRQMVEIASVLRERSQVLILDEPTAALTYAETDLLFRRIGELRDQGVGIIYISHRMEEIKRIADRITVLRDGVTVATREARAVELDEIVRLMVGREVGSVQRRAVSPGALALKVTGLGLGRAVNDVSFELRKGEILGFAGLMGSGRTETMRLVFGADLADRGAVYLGGATTPAVIRSPRDAVRLGLAFLTEDRKGQGLLLPLAIRENVTLASLPALAWRGLVLNRRAQAAAAAELLDALQVRCRDGEQAVGDLSGGNQQKVVIAKWLFRNCDVLIFDEPTRGIDVGAKFEIYRLLDDLSQKGKAIIVVSSDLRELMAIADRIAVMSAGRLAATFPRGQWTQEAIMAAALSEYAQTGATGT
jgi:ribose transport system ATP-binding protein